MYSYSNAYINREGLACLLSVLFANPGSYRPKYYLWEVAEMWRKVARWAGKQNTGGPDPFKNQCFFKNIV